MHRCRNFLPFGSIVGKWECAQDYGNGTGFSSAVAYRTDGEMVQQGIITATNPEDGMVARTSFKIEGDYVIQLGGLYSAE